MHFRVQGEKFSQKVGTFLRLAQLLKSHRTKSHANLPKELYLHKNHI